MTPLIGFDVTLPHVTSTDSRKAEISDKKKKIDFEVNFIKTERKDNKIDPPHPCPPPEGMKTW